MVEFLRDWHGRHGAVKPLMTMMMTTMTTMMMKMMMMMVVVVMMVMVIFLTSGIGMAGIDAAVKPIARKVKKTCKIDGIVLPLFLATLVALHFTPVSQSVSRSVIVSD